MWSHKTEDGYSLCAYPTGYMDWGLDIVSPGGRVMLTNPCYLSNDSWGFNYPEDEESSDERTPWSDREWEDALKQQADDLIEGVME